jgi:CBS domain-containing protein
MLSRGDILARVAEGDEPVSAIASRDVIAVSPDDTLFAALHRMLNEGVEHLPVVAAGRLVGICTRTDILRARARQLEHELAQPGWRRAAPEAKVGQGAGRP